MLTARKPYLARFESRWATIGRRELLLCLLMLELRSRVSFINSLQDRLDVSGHLLLPRHCGIHEALPRIIQGGAASR
jgi:hypothetical protein